MLAVNGTTWLRMYSAYRRHSTSDRAITPKKRAASPGVASATDTFLYATLVLGCLRLTLPQEHFGILHTVVSPANYGWLMSAATFFFLVERSTTVANFGKLAPLAAPASSTGTAAAQRSGRSQSPSRKPRSRSQKKLAKGLTKNA
jgi:hypothetical protein|eukprot:COSAG02_NODE_6736_length_3393_cov_18.505768_2_plen_145_part_00